MLDIFEHCSAVDIFEKRDHINAACRTDRNSATQPLPAAVTDRLVNVGLGANRMVHRQILTKASLIRIEKSTRTHSWMDTVACAFETKMYTHPAGRGLGSVGFLFVPIRATPPSRENPPEPLGTTERVAHGLWHSQPADWRLCSIFCGSTLSTALAQLTGSSAQLGQRLGWVIGPHLCATFQLMLLKKWVTFATYGLALGASVRRKAPETPERINPWQGSGVGG